MAQSRTSRTVTVERQDVGELASRLRLSATRLARQLRRQSDAGLTPSQLSALAAVERHGPLTLGALAEHERVAPPTITRVVAKLVEDGLLDREVDAADRRVQRVAITPTAAELLVEIRSRKDLWLATRLAELDPDHVAALHAALDALDALTERPPDAQKGGRR